MKKFTCATILAACLLPLPCLAQTGDAASWATLLQNHYQVYPDQVYGTANNVELKLDVWENQDTKTPLPTVIYIHGGGWVFGDRAGAVPELLPYLQKGWNVVNVEYRMAGESPAPAAVEDVRCALRWVYRNAATYHIDTNRIVVSGHSAGGHLALMAGMLPEGTDLDSQCPSGSDEPPIKVAAIVNWFGITDVNEILQGPDRQTYAVAWIGAQPEKEALARRVSPLTYVRAGLPPIISIHGDRDPTVPYSQAESLHEALTRANVPNQLVTIPNGGHGSFSDDRTSEAFRRVWSFLEAHRLGGGSTAAEAEGR